MPRSTCPKCSAVLQISDDMVNEQIECGNCKAIFVAKLDPPASRRSPDENRPSRRRMSDPEDEERPSRRRREESDEDNHPRRRRDLDEGNINGKSTGIGQGLAITSLALGVLALVLSLLTGACYVGCVGVPLAIVSIILGIVGMKQSKGMAIAGIITSVLAFIMTAVMMIYFGVQTARFQQNNPQFGPQRNNNPPFGPQRNNPPPPWKR